MTNLSDVFVADAVSHAYNLEPSNYAVEKYADQAVRITIGTEDVMPREYRRTKESLLTDWPARDTANVLFHESQTDFSVFHPQSINIFKDGLTAEAKARDFVEQYPTRGAALADVDLIADDEPQAELTRQVDEYGVHGVKVYPSYWSQDDHHSFRMDDSETAFPLWEHCADLGLDVVAVHKAVPIGSVPMEPYKVGDIDEAANSFPDLNFEIVHGGMAFAEETGWQLARHPNVYLNLEITSMQAIVSPDRFIQTMQDLLYPGGEHTLDKILWGTGATQFHPQLLLEEFWNLEFPEMESLTGPFTIGEAEKQKILGANLMEAHNLDREEIERGIADDKFSDRQELASPWSTTEFQVVS